MKTEDIFAFGIALLLVLSIAGCQPDLVDNDNNFVNDAKLEKFSSLTEIKDAFEKSGNSFSYYGLEYAMTLSAGSMKKASVISDSSSTDFSKTNMQVEGVDEADIVKTDGNYVYAIAKGYLYIIQAEPVADAKILSKIKVSEISYYSTSEMFIYGDRLLVFGSSYENTETNCLGKLGDSCVSSRRGMQLTNVKIYDTSDKESPVLVKTHDFEGSYVTSRMVGDNVYFVINSYTYSYDGDIIPLYREDNSDFVQIAKPTDIGFVEPLNAQGFVTVVGLSITDEGKEISKEVIVGSGQNVFASENNLYIAQTNYPSYDLIGNLAKDYSEKTVVTKFNFNHGKVKYSATGDVKGHILNQFSMDESDGYFRIATTKGEVWDSVTKSSNNVYVLDDDLKVVGELEDLAPGEKIYSVRFMGKKAYVVTFKKVDPLFVIDLSDAANPKVLGKLKIPGYSDYLHPYDENHVIGIGKDTVEAEESLKTGRGLDFAWYQGLKMAIFDVTDVENPKEMYKVVIGDRGTDSYALQDHKAFLFDKEKNLLVLPVTLAEIKGEKTVDNQYGEYTFQGAYVYNLDLENGFDLKGKISHYDNDDVYLKSGYYFSGGKDVKRSLYINDVLYTFSDARLQLNDLNSLDTLKKIDFN